MGGHPDQSMVPLLPLLPLHFLCQPLWFPLAVFFVHMPVTCARTIISAHCDPSNLQSHYFQLCKTRTDALLKWATDTQRNGFLSVCTATSLHWLRAHHPPLSHVAHIACPVFVVTSNSVTTLTMCQALSVTMSIESQLQQLKPTKLNAAQWPSLWCPSRSCTHPSTF